jgi:hypothetical protein
LIGRGAKEEGKRYKCSGKHFDFSGAVKKALANKLQQKFEEYVRAIPDVMCYMCAAMMYSKLGTGENRHWITIDSETQSPAGHAYPDHKTKLVYHECAESDGSNPEGESGGETMGMRKARVCTNCCSLWKKAGKPTKLDEFELCLGISGPGQPIRIPDELSWEKLGQKVSGLLSRVRIQWYGAPCSSAGVAYSKFTGTCKKTPNDFEGVLGLVYSDSTGAPLSEEDMGNLKEALKVLIKDNRFYHYLQEDDAYGTVRDFLSLEKKFPGLLANEVKFKLAQVVGNNQQKQWTKASGSGYYYFLPVDPIDSSSHSVDINDIPVGIELGMSGKVTFGDLALEAKVFPCLYPLGTGFHHPSMYKSDSAHNMSPSHYYKSRIRAPDPMWRRNKLWTFFMFDWMEKRRIHEGQQVMVKPDNPTYSGKNLTAGVAATACDRDSDVRRHFVPSSVVGSKADMKKKFLNLCSLVNAYGSPDLFLTLTCNEAKWADVLERANGRPLHECPVEVVEQFHRRFKRLFGLRNTIFGKVDHYFVKLEYQNRNAPHYHILLWLKDKEDICKHVSASIPGKQNVPYKKKSSRKRREAAKRSFGKSIGLLRERVLRYQIHKHDCRCMVWRSIDVVESEHNGAVDQLASAMESLNELSRQNDAASKELLIRCMSHIDSMKKRLKKLSDERTKLLLEEGDAPSDTLGEGK